MAYKSAYGDVAVSLRQALAREGVNTGGSAGYPRVELHSFVEGEPMDKQDSIRTLTATVESLSVVSPDEAEELNAENLEIIEGWEYDGPEFTVFGKVPKSLQDMQEVGDSQVVYRVLQTVDLYIQQQTN